MLNLIRVAIGIALLIACTAARATYETYEIVELYSNADGTIQFVLLHEYAGADNQNLLAAHTLTVTHAGRTKTFVFPFDLPSNRTANRYVLIGTQSYYDLLADDGAASPDYIMPNQFLPTDGGTVNYAGVDEVSFAGLPTDGSSALYTPSSAASYIDTAIARNFAGVATTVPALAVTAVEYYNPALDHFFISNLQPDIDALDSGRIPGWVRTGGEFYVFATAAAGYSPVCRYYIPPQHGNSHFFSASPSECNAIASRIGFDPNYSGYVLETSAAFYIALPNTQTGACPAGTTPVYRLWNGGPDSNHRYTSSLAVKAQMLALGYIAEGYGPDAVAMCSPV